MLASQRQARIVEEVRRQGAVRVSELTRLFGVSDMTIRRDLDVLAAQGFIDKVHGGATKTQSIATYEPGFEAKWLTQQVEKEAIAAAAAVYAVPGSAVGITAGTTTWRLAHILRDVGNLTIVTNSIQVAQVFHAGTAPGQTVVITGGVRTPSDALVGPVAISALRQLHLDVVFLGVHGMDPLGGFSTPNLLEAEVNRAFVEAGRQLVVVADHTKWRQVGLSTMAPLDAANAVVTDDGLDALSAAELGDHVQELVLAKVKLAARSEAGPA